MSLPSRVGRPIGLVATLIMLVFLIRLIVYQSESKSIKPGETAYFGKPGHVFTLESSMENLALASAETWGFVRLSGGDRKSINETTAVNIYDTRRTERVCGARKGGRGMHAETRIATAVLVVVLEGEHEGVFGWVWSDQLRDTK